MKNTTLRGILLIKYSQDLKVYDQINKVEIYCHQKKKKNAHNDFDRPIKEYNPGSQKEHHLGIFDKKRHLEI